MFYIPKDKVNFEYASSFGNKTALLVSRSPPQDIHIIKADAKLELCAPQTVHACLIHLDRLGLVPTRTSKLLVADGNPLFNDMVANFSKSALASKGEVIALSEKLERAKSAREAGRIANAIRNFALAKIVLQLQTLGVRATLTDSVGDLIPHLKSGLPAYISTSSAMIATVRPSCNRNPRPPSNRIGWPP